MTVYCVMDYVRAGDLPSQIAEDLDLSMEQVQAALEIIVPAVEHRPRLEVRAESQGPSQGNREEDFLATDETRMEHG